MGRPLPTLYAKFRGSSWFLAILCIVCASWVFAHEAFGLDPGWGLLNLFLSVEASLSVAVLIMAGERGRIDDETHKKYLLHLLEAQIAHMELIQAAFREGRGDSSIGRLVGKADDGG